MKIPLVLGAALACGTNELYRFAQDHLRLDYVFWGTQEPYYSDEILPYLRNLVLGDGS